MPLVGQYGVAGPMTDGGTIITSKPVNRRTVIAKVYWSSFSA